MTRDLRRLGIHESVRAVFPAEALRRELDDLELEVVVIDDDPAAIEDCDAVVTFDHRAAFLGEVGWIHSIQSGVDRFPFGELEASGTILTNSAGIHGDSVGETVLGYLLMFARHLHRHRWNQAKARWDRPAWDEAFTLTGESLCVLGLGALGRGIATRADAMGMSVVGVRRSPAPVEGVDRVVGSDELLEVVGDATFVAVALPLTSATEGLIDAEVLGRMRSDAYLINVGRGPIVDETALIEALEADDIAGAALDVFEEEPLPPSSPLWNMENVIVTPHTAAQTRDYYRDIAELVRDNVGRMRRGEELHNRVV